MTNDEKIALLTIHGFGAYGNKFSSNTVRTMRVRIKRNNREHEYMIAFESLLYGPRIAQGDSPSSYTAVAWPDISAVSEDLIFELIALNKEEQ